MTKICCGCKEEKDLEEFSWRNEAEKIKARECKECHRDIRKIYYENNKKKEIARVAQRRKETIAWFKDFKSTLNCNRCSEDHVATLHFHHLDPNEKDEAVSKIIRKGWSIKRILEEISKCEVLCANCHAKEHYERG
jgi:hypothetical protein